MRDSRLTRHARDNRKAASEPEQRLWLELRAARFHAVKFRRQKVIGDYIADFAANDPKLVIELDGDSHAAQVEYDAQRTAFLEAEGYTVLCFGNNDVMGNMDGVLTSLAKVVAGLRARPPLPTLSPEGERTLGRENPRPFRGEEGAAQRRKERGSQQ